MSAPIQNGTDRELTCSLDLILNLNLNLILNREYVRKYAVCEHKQLIKNKALI